MSRTKSVLLVFGPACLWLIVVSIGFYAYSTGESKGKQQVTPSTVANVQLPTPSEGIAQKTRNVIGGWLTSLVQKFSSGNNNDEATRKLVEENLRLENEVLRQYQQEHKNDNLLRDQENYRRNRENFKANNPRRSR